MSLTVFLAICILGCDVLIYFLYEWAFGESKRIRKRHASSGLWAASEEASAGYQSRAERQAPGATQVMEMNRGRRDRGTSARPDSYREAVAYRRLAASFVQLKPRM